MDMALKAIELRIGNYYQENGTYYKTTPNDIINLIRCEASKTESDMQPVPLTEDILLKCGFKKDGKSYCIGYWDCDFTLEQYSDEVFYMVNVSESLKFGPEIRYLHQLQNIYFALEEEELEVKL